MWSKYDQRQHTLLPGAFQAHPNLLHQYLPFLGMPLWWFMCTVKFRTRWAPAGIPVSPQPHSGVPKYQNYVSWELRRNPHPEVPSLRFCFWEGTKTKPPQVVICCRLESCLWGPFSPWMNLRALSIKHRPFMLCPHPRLYLCLRIYTTFFIEPDLFPFCPEALHSWIPL